MLSCSPIIIFYDTIKASKARQAAMDMLMSELSFLWYDNRYKICKIAKNAIGKNLSYNMDNYIFLDFSLGK